MKAIGEQGRTQLLVYVAAALLVAFAAFRLLGGEREEAPPPPVEIQADGAGAGAGDGAQKVYVHVAGAVREAGLYRLPGRARVGTAIDRAGGVTPRAELAGVNLAAEVQDGQQVLVPTRGAAAAASATSSLDGASEPSSAGGAPAAPVSLAQATPEQLDAAVEGIGPVLAAAIIGYRDENGGVSSIDELREVHGIGDERLGALTDALVP